MSITDMIEEQDAMKAHFWDVLLWPKLWQSYCCSCAWSWEICRLRDVERGNVPDQPGIYTLLVQPGVAEHPACSYLMYVGQTTSLRRRFGEYLNRERREIGRPKVFRLLNKYSDYMWFCFSELPRESLTEIEEALVTAYMPPCNDQLPASIRAVRGAF